MHKHVLRIAEILEKKSTITISFDAKPGVSLLTLIFIFKVRLLASYLICEYLINSDMWQNNTIAWSVQIVKAKMMYILFLSANKS